MTSPHIYGDVQRNFVYSSCPNNHVFLLLLEADGAILHMIRMVCRMRSEFINIYGRGQGVHVATPLQEEVNIGLSPATLC